MPGLYQVNDPSEKALKGYQSASATTAAMDKRPQQPQQQTSAFGAMSSASAGMSLGATVGTTVSAGASAGPWGAVIGGAVGLLSYFLM